MNAVSAGRGDERDAGRGDGRDADRGVSPVIGVVLLVAIAVALAALVGAAVIGISDEPDESAPSVVMTADFTASSDIDPHWTLAVTHESGDAVAAGDLAIRFVTDEAGATVRYPEQFETGDRFRAELWGAPHRADTTECLANPDPDTDDQLDGFTDAGEHDESVEVMVVHEPTNTLLHEETVDLAAESDRFDGTERHYLVDGVTPSIDCPDYTGDF